MKRFKIVAAILLAGLVVASSTPVRAFSLSEELECDSNVRKLEGLWHDIAIVNLLNVLYLSPEQLDGLIGLHQQRNFMVEQTRARLAREVPSSIEVFSALRHVILSGRTPEEKLAEKVFRRGEAREYLEDIRSIAADEYRHDREELVDEIFWDFESLIAARSGTDTDQVRTRIGRYLDWIRSLPAVEFELYDKEPAEEILGKLPDEPQEDELREKVCEFLLHPRAVPFLKKLRASR